jgi:S-adenosylmethionine hydrolase
MSKIITLTTDFGLTDEFVGVMKGVILARTPATKIVDLSHNIERHNIGQAALLIRSAYHFFPEGTIHVLVIDPGVGSSRRLIMLQADNHFFLAPDNGVLGLFFETECFQAVYEIKCEQYFLSPLSTTFHGRDILAPVAAEMAAGLDVEAVGPVISASTLRKLDITPANIDRKQGIITGEIIRVDHFGNLQTNISESSLADLYNERKATVRIRLKNTIINGIESAYTGKNAGEVLALLNSWGFLEIAVNKGDAGKVLGSGPGDTVTVSE